MNNLRQAAQRALKAMEDGEYGADMIEFSDALIALRAALAEPEQDKRTTVADLRDAMWLDPECADRGACQSLKFKGPAPTPRKPLSDDEFISMLDSDGIAIEPELAFIIKEMVERAHGIGEQT